MVDVMDMPGSFNRNKNVTVCIDALFIGGFRYKYIVKLFNLNMFV